MTYVDGFLLAVPTANKDAYLAHAREGAALLTDFGARRLVEGWGDDVPRGTRIDYWGAVQARDDETVLFSWIEYADKPTRDAAVARMMTNPRMAAMAATMPFDGARMIFGGFEAGLEDGAADAPGYVDGFVLPVSPANKAAYFEIARRASAVFRDNGATRVVEAWGDDVPQREVTDFPRAAHASGDEVVVFAWIEWPDKATRDAGMAAAMADPRMQTPPAELPFDGKRMIFGGFVPLLDA